MKYRKLFLATVGATAGLAVLVVAAAALALAAAFSPAAAQDWMTGAEMPTARSEKAKDFSIGPA